MSTLIVLIGLSMSSVSTELLTAIEKVESAGNEKAVGDGGMAVGCLQIWPVVVQDVNRISGKKYTLKDRLNRQKSIEMCRIYLTHYGKAYQNKTGKKPTDEVLSRCWNGGGNGWKKKSTLDYWKKIKTYL